MNDDDDETDYGTDGQTLDGDGDGTDTTARMDGVLVTNFQVRHCDQYANVTVNP